MLDRELKSSGCYNRVVSWAFFFYSTISDPPKNLLDENLQKAFSLFLL